MFNKLSKYWFQNIDMDIRLSPLQTIVNMNQLRNAPVANKKVI